MPELPEVESVRRTLAQRVVNRVITAVAVRRAGVITGRHDANALLVSQRVKAVDRHGKQLFIAGQRIPSPSGRGQGEGAPEVSIRPSTMRSTRVSLGAPSPAAAQRTLPGVPGGEVGGGCVSVHLGMTGSLVWSASAGGESARHTHVTWSFDDGSTLWFHDPRRFGGLWTFNSVDEARAARLSSVGPDALAITADELSAALRKSRRPIKSALLDQAILAGVGNIYADELLFRCGVHPLTPACRLKPPAVVCLVEQMRLVLHEAIAAGGSSVRDYVDGDGRSGAFQLRHRVYGRSGQACVTCGYGLRGIRLAGRATVFCPACQPRPRRLTRFRRG